jgi:hypothetical protein
MITPSVAFRFFAFNTHDPRVLRRLLGIFLRGLIGAVGIAVAISVIVVGGTWFVSNLDRVRKRLGGAVKRPGP